MSAIIFLLGTANIISLFYELKICTKRKCKATQENYSVELENLLNVSNVNL